MNEPFNFQQHRQHLGRMHRAGTQRIVYSSKSVEEQIADRFRSKLNALQITDETVMFKSGQIILLGRSEGVGHSLHPEGLDKK